MSQTLFLLYRPEPARPMLKTKSVGAHSICARGGLSCRKRARADMQSAPTFFVAGGEGRVFAYRVCRGDHWSPANLPPQRIFRDSCLVRQAGTGEQCSPLQEFSPVWARNISARRTVLSPTACGRSPLAEGAKRGRCPAWSCLPLSKTKSVGAYSICARGGLSYRKRARADMESAPTFFCSGSPPHRMGQGARFCLLCVQADLFPLLPCQKPSYVVYYFSTSPQANPVQTGDAKL